MTLEEFQRYWREEHAPLVRRHAEALAIRRYVQTHTRPSPMGEAVSAARGGVEVYDGVAEIWFDSQPSPRISTPPAFGCKASAAMSFRVLARSPPSCEQPN